MGTRGEEALPDTAGGRDGGLAGAGTGGFPCGLPCGAGLLSRTGVVPPGVKRERIWDINFTLKKLHL